MTPDKSLQRQSSPLSQLAEVDWPPEVGNVTFKINSYEALSDESVKKSNSDKVLNDDFS